MDIAVHFFRTFLFISYLSLLSSQAVSSNISVENYGLLPAYRSFSISPDGKHYAYIKREGEKDYFVIFNIKDGKLVGAVDAGKYTPESIYFATNQHVIITTSKHQRLLGFKGAWEHSGSLAYNIETKKLKVLLNKTKGLFPAQSGLGRIVGINQNEMTAYMPAYYGERYADPQNHLFRVNLDTGRGKIHARGNHHTIDWFVDENGSVLAREDYRNDKDEHQIYSKISGKWKLIFSHKSPMLSISVQAVSTDGKYLLFVDDKDNNEAIYSMSLEDGQIDGPILHQEGSDIDHLLTDDRNRKFQAVKYSGFKPIYQFSDENYSKFLAALSAYFPMSSVHFVSSTADKKLLLIYVSGYEEAGSYMLFDSEDSALTHLVSEYPKVKEIGELKPIRYTARDNLKIPAIITLPTDTKKRKNLPLIVLPHGGPEAYDRISFDWMAQFLARKGYAVLQPNFRGSTGFGYEFRNAGRGKWGREMQDDVSDGVKALVASGYVDPSRVCIMGASYGGYSALAGGAFSPELYRCVIAINGVSDVLTMLKNEKFEHGRDHWVVSYWEKVIGNSKTEREKLKNVSPANFAEQFQAPVLLIHGNNDKVVPIKQSKIMHKALKKADKNVELLVLKGEDHSLSFSSTRLATLTAINRFLDEYNPVD